LKHLNQFFEKALFSLNVITKNAYTSISEMAKQSHPLLPFFLTNAKNQFC
jgi:hypothetical protein